LPGLAQKLPVEKGKSSCESRKTEKLTVESGKKILRKVMSRMMGLNMCCCESYGDFARHDQGWELSGFAAGEVTEAAVGDGIGSDGTKFA